MTGRSSETAVANSWKTICMLPSPAMSSTVFSGNAHFAPMDAGNPNPMVPKPPEVMNCLG